MEASELALPERKNQFIIPGNSREERQKHFSLPFLFWAVILIFAAPNLYSQILLPPEADDVQWDKPNLNKNRK
jgi:hypothetical protein